MLDFCTGRRFIVFKTLYYDHTPDDYEPPGFQRGDSVKDRWFFCTHRGKEPEQWDCGSLKTGHHG
jgi:meiosis-specific protein HOP1